MKYFVGIGRKEATVHAIDDGEKAAAGALERAHENDDHVRARIQVYGVLDAVLHFARSLDLLAQAEGHLDRQQLDELVEEVEWREEDQIPAGGGHHQVLVVLEVVEYGLAEQEVHEHAAAEAREHARQVAGERMPLVEVGQR